MTTKEELIESAKKALSQEELIVFEKLLNENNFNKIRLISEENLEKSKSMLFENAIKDYCDPIVVSHFKMSDDFFNKTLDYVIYNIDVK